MGRKYLKIKIEGKNMLVDLSVLPMKEVTFSIGTLENKEFKMEKEISLDKLEEML